MSEGTAGRATPPSGAAPRDSDETLHVLVADGVVIVAGELDLDSAPRLAAILRDTAARRVDLAGLTFVDVAGLRSLAEVPGLEIVRVGPVAERLLRLCGLGEWSALGATT